jgi:hypothetical protein
MKLQEKYGEGVLEAGGLNVITSVYLHHVS